MEKEKPEVKPSIINHTTNAGPGCPPHPRPKAMHILKHAIYLLLLLVLAGSCSTVDNMPEWERLYTGIKKTEIHDQKKTYEESVAVSEVKAALAYAPNNSLFGSSSVRSIFPIGLWIHDRFEGLKNPTGFDKWLNRSFGSEYVTVNAVNPATRTKIATNTLQNYGYFNGYVDYKLIDQKDPRKQKIKYDIHLGEPYKLHTVKYLFKGRQDSIVQAHIDERHLHECDQFSVVNLDEERSRLVNDMRDNGYFYFRDDYLSYFADSTRHDKEVELVVGPHPDAPIHSQKQMNIGSVRVAIRKNIPQSGNRQSSPRDSTVSDSVRRAERRRLIAYDDSLVKDDIKFVYQGEDLPISHNVLKRNIKIEPKQLYQKSLFDETTRNISNMQMFRQIQWNYTPRDTTDSCNVLDVNLNLTMDQPIDVEAEFSFTQKSNDQVGPHGKVSFAKRNAFGHGETMKVDLIGSYEWHTKSVKYEGETPPDSYEAGLNFSLSYPWLAFPGLSKKRFKFPSSTTFKADIDHLNRAGYYRLLTFGLEAKYNFQTSPFIKHEVIPLTVKYNHLLATTEKFDSISIDNLAIYMSMSDQFIPAMQYTFTYDNSSRPLSRSITHFDFTVKEAGNLINGVSTLSGRKYSEEDKEIFGTPYAQFIKLQGQLINYFKLTDNSTLATRLKGGVIWSYGNSSFAPYSEMFFIGGANSIRAFTARSFGPGSYYEPALRRMSVFQVGDILLEANAEYRFKMLSNLYGALFLDAGNIWMLKEDLFYEGGKIGETNFLKSIALGTGFGLRYDLKFLVLRLDLGIGIHAPYDTGKRGYYNIPKFKDGIGIHFAVGYPF